MSVLQNCITVRVSEIIIDRIPEIICASVPNQCWHFEQIIIKLPAFRKLYLSAFRDIISVNISVEYICQHFGKSYWFAFRKISIACISEIKIASVSENYICQHFGNSTCQLADSYNCQHVGNYTC